MSDAHAFDASWTPVIEHLHAHIEEECPPQTQVAAVMLMVLFHDPVRDMGTWRHAVATTERLGWEEPTVLGTAHEYLMTLVEPIPDAFT